MQYKDKIYFWIFLLLITVGFFNLKYFISQAALDSSCDGLTVEECSKKAKTYEAIIKIKKQQANTIQSQLSIIDMEQSRNQNDLSKAHDSLQTLEQQIANLQKDIQEKEYLIKYQEAVLSNLMQSYYENDQQGILNIVLMEKNFSEIFKQLDYTEQTSVKISDVLGEIRTVKADLEKNQSDLQAKKDESEQLKEGLEQKNLSLQSTENKKQTLLTQTQEEKAQYEKLLNSIEDEIYDLESGKSVDYSNIPAAKGGYFDYPVSNPRITQGYGMTSYARAGAYGGKPHNGIDFGVSYTSVYAVKEGRVIGSGDNGRYAYGKWIAIDHGDGLVTLYGHFSKKSVNKGDTVKKGEKIGVSGNTGNSTGPHLHFSVFDKSFRTVESKYVNGLMIPTGASVNPNRYLK
jgi:murein DD-endopeptidase MepM/ murein hydrolase activator NlpD